MASRAALAASALLGAFALLQATQNLQPDLFIYRHGAALALHGESPYDSAKIRAAVAEQFPQQVELQNNCGFFLPPAAVLLFAPFAILPWSAAKAVWAVICGVSAFGLAGLACRSSSRRFEWLLPCLLVVNYLTIAIVLVGQTTLLTVGCTAFGMRCFEKGRPVSGTLLWSVAFLKPHLAVPLIPLAWYLGGWKRAAVLLLVVAVENAIGAVIIGGSPLFLVDYLDFLASGHKAVVFNLAARSYEMTSWNRLLVVLTGTAVEQSAAMTVAGHLIWFGLVLARVALAKASPSVSWALAAAAIGSTFVPQAMGYEVLILALAVPWVQELAQSGYRTRALFAAALMVAQLVPFGMMESLGITFHRPLGVALLAVLVLFGPIQPLHVPSSDQSPPADR